MTAILQLGGNEGDVAGTFAAARGLLEQRVGAIVRASSLHRSAPWGDFADDAADFLNQVVIVETSLEPFALLDTTQGIERELGRHRVIQRSDAQASRRGIHERSDSFFADGLASLADSTGTKCPLKDAHSTLYSSRPIDIDILFYDDLVIDTPRLKIPHPLIAQREFVLIPLKEVAPERVRS